MVVGGIVATTGIKPSSMSPVHLCRLCTGGAVGSEPTFTSAHQFDTLVIGLDVRVLAMVFMALVVIFSTLKNRLAAPGK